MKILFASTVFPHASEPTRGTYNLALCRALAELRTGRDRHEVRVCAPRMWQTALRQRGGRPIDYGSIDRVDYPTFLYMPGRSRRKLASWLAWSMGSSIRRLTRDWKPDVVLSYWADPDGTAALEWARRLEAKFGVIVGGSDVLMLPHRPVLSGLIEDTLEHADLVATVSDQLTRAVKELCPGIANVQCLRQGIDGGKFHDGDAASARSQLGLNESKPTFVWVGRLDPVKNLSLLLDAFAKVRERCDAQLAIVGDGTERNSVRAKIDELSLTDSVRLAGAVPPESLGDWYRAADATVMSSHSEGLPNVLRESLACGRPFASVNVGGISEIGDDTCRILTTASDVDELANAMHHILDPVYREAAVHYPVRTWNDAALDFETAFHSLPGTQSIARPVRHAEVAIG